MFPGHSLADHLPVTVRGMNGSWVRKVLAALDRLKKAAPQPEHLKIGRRGEEATYFYLRRQGYVIVARNFRAPHQKGEIDLIGWDGEDLCFIEVKTRSRHSMIAAEAAVDAPKQAMLRASARAYLRRLKADPPVRFDVVSLYFQNLDGTPDITLFKNAFPMS